MSLSNKEIVRRWLDALNAGNHDLLDEIVHPDFVRHSEATPDVDVRSLEEFKEFDRQTRTVFSDVLVKLDMLIAEDDKVAFWGSFSGKQIGPLGPFPASGKGLKSDIGGVFRLEGGKIAELWVTWDNLSGLVQLGHFPSPSSPPD